MNIELIKSTVELLKIANVTSYVTIAELARELKIQKTKLVQFIEDNKKYFILSDRWESKTKTVNTTFGGRKYKDTVQVRGKHLGLCIEEAFLRIDDNYQNIEWVERMQVERGKYLYVTEANNYGFITGYYFDIDKDENHKYRYHLWRNTQAKIDSIKQYLHEGRFVVGGFGDSSSYIKKYAITNDNLNYLKSIGYTFNDYRPLNK